MNLRSLWPVSMFILLLSCRGSDQQPVAPPTAGSPPTTTHTLGAAPPAAVATATNNPTMSNYNPLTQFEADVIERKGTERAFTGEYTDTKDEGTYVCRRCNAALYSSKDKFHSGCGWPSFDDELPGAVERHDDTSHGMVRTEIVCTNCKGHLGHVFLGDPTSPNGTRHCVNSVSMRFVPAGKPLPKVVVPSKK